MLLEILSVIIALFILLYWHVTKYYSHWKNLGVPQIDPSFPFGTYGSVMTLQKHPRISQLEYYNKFKSSPYYGTYFIRRPILMIKDVNLVKHMLVKDFDHFINRSNLVNRERLKQNRVDDVWIKQLASLTGDEWKSVRSTFSPMFTSGKLKAMMGLIEHVANNLSAAVASSARDFEMIELKKLFGMYSMDGIATCAFGVDAKSFDKDHKSEFVQYAQGVFSRNMKDRLKLMISFLPYGRNILGLLGITLAKKRETEFFLDVIEQTLEHRRNHKGAKKNDMIDLMIEALENLKKDDSANEGTENEHDKDQFELDSRLKGSKTKINLDDSYIIATALIVLIAGYDTTAQTLAYLGYRLALNPAIQKTLQEEIDEAYDNSGGNLPNYSTIQSLPYLDMVLHETMRMHPAVDVLNRNCVKDYQIPNSNILIKKGEDVHFHVIGIHYDPDVYPNPGVFNPENFSKENRAKRSPYSFLTFGQGPRACIGMRFALLEAKIACVTLMRKFSFVRCEKTAETLELDPRSILGGVKGGLWVRAEKRALGD